MSLFLSIIIPAHNEETRLPDTLRQVFAFLERQPYSSEVLVIENGSRDRTFEVAQAFLSRFPSLRLFHEDLPGKGRAVRRGIFEAQGAYRFIADADLSMPIEQINRFLPPQSNADIVIASREAPGAVRYHEPAYRHLTGRVFNFFIRLLLLPDLQDTQCGFKCFRATVAMDIFSRQTLTGWAFDVEILAIARRRGYTIVELGIPWYYNSESKVRVLRDAIRMFLDLLRIRRNLSRGLYD
ncbi:MAG: glycosyltransferase family 2 protein [Anaerolineales bacterium]|nr:glycosyltransferase family 2 protein [Anaerolineales bacterium]MDW8226831.1 glycosyltransferase family 2 protein [Anaerolineales bacterium]